MEQLAKAALLHCQLFALRPTPSGFLAQSAYWLPTPVAMRDGQTCQARNLA
jgi:hypothetical protein